MTLPLGLARRCAVIALLASVATPSLAAAPHDPFIYPAQGQSPAQQDNDNYHCYRWAMDQTGFDPTTGAIVAPSTASPVRGAAAGAVVGAVGGAVGGNAGTGAAIGAGVGAVVGGARRHQQQAKQAAAIAAAKDSYNRAFGACMTGKGYTVR